MKKTSKTLCALYLVSSLSACVSVPPNIEACTPMSDPFDVLAERQTGFCKYTMGGEERVVDGEIWKNKVRSGVIVDFENWVKFTQWAKKECRKNNSECLGK